MIAAELLHLMEHPHLIYGTVRDLIGDLRDAAMDETLQPAQARELLLAAAHVLDEIEGTVKS